MPDIKDTREFKAALKEELQGLKANRDDLLEEKRELAEKLALATADITESAEFKSALEKALEKATAGLTANRDEILAEKGQLKTKLEEALKMFSGVHVNNAVDLAIVSQRCNPVASRDIRAAARDVFTVDGDEIKTADGKTPDAWLQEQKTTSPHWWGLNAGGGSGGGSNVSGRNSVDNSIENMTGKQKLAAAMQLNREIN